jgi:hypothetical protein
MYKVVVADTIPDLESQIIDLILNGWISTGGVCVAPDYGRIRYFQAMVNYSI